MSYGATILWLLSFQKYGRNFRLVFSKCFPQNCCWDPILLSNCSDSFDGLHAIKFKGEMRKNMIPRLAKSSNLCQDATRLQMSGVELFNHSSLSIFSAPKTSRRTGNRSYFSHQVASSVNVSRPYLWWPWDLCTTRVRFAIAIGGSRSWESYLLAQTFAHTANLRSIKHVCKFKEC